MQKEKSLKERLIEFGRKKEVEYIEHINSACVSAFIDRFTLNGKEMIMDKKELERIAQNICIERLMPVIEDIIYKNIPFYENMKEVINNITIIPIIDKIREDASAWREDYRQEILLSAFRKNLSEKHLNKFEEEIWKKMNVEKLTIKQLLQKFEVEEKLTEEEKKKIEEVYENFQKKFVLTLTQETRGKSNKGLASGIIMVALEDKVNIDLYRKIQKSLKISRKVVIESNKDYMKKLLMLEEKVK